MKKQILFVIFASLAVGVANAGQTGFYYKSDPGAPIGHRVEAFYTDSAYKFTVGPIYSPNTWTNTVFAQITHPDSYLSSYLPYSTYGTNIQFSAPAGSNLIVGEYVNAISRPLIPSEDAILWFSRGGMSAACTLAPGEFSVKEAAWDYEKQSLVSFAVDFVQRCEGSTGASYGYLRFNSYVPFPDNLPPAIASETSLNAEGCMEATSPTGADVPLYVVNGQPTDSYNWLTEVVEQALTETCDDGISLCGGPMLFTPSNRMQSSPTVTRTIEGTGDRYTFPLGIGEYAKVTLNTQHLDNSTEEAYMRACVMDTTPPSIEFLSPSDGQKIVGNNLLLNVRLNDAADMEPKLVHVTVGGQELALDPKHPNLIRLPKPDLKSEQLPLVISVTAKDSQHNIGSSSITVFRAHDRRPE